MQIRTGKALPWVALGLMACALIGGWLIHRRGQIARDQRVENAMRDKRILTSALYDAVFNNDAPTLDRLLRENPHPPLDPLSMLEDAAARGQIGIVSVLIKNGADVNGLSGHGAPLRTAAAHGQQEVVTLLLRNGASVNATTVGGWSALFSAVYSNQVKIAAQLIEAGANVNGHWVAPGLTPEFKHRHWPVDRKTQPANVVFGPPRNYPQRDVSPVMLAAWRGQPEMIRLLLKHHPDLALRTEKGETALDLAKKEGYQEIVRMLKQVRG